MDRYGQIIGPDYLVAGRYRLRSKLGGGGMGAVWLAHDRLLDRDVAIKQIITPAGLGSIAAKKLRENVIREGRAAAKLSHKHAIAVYDVALEAGEPWLVMEYLPSRSLAKALSVRESLPVIEIAQIGAQVADALADAHAAGIVHRDLKPGNILIAERGAEAGIAKVSDFGIAAAVGDNHDENTITGTPAYLPPEIARGADPTPASDVFSLGATLYTAIEGQPPFGIDTDGDALVLRSAQGQIIPPSRSGIVTDALLHMLEPHPARRPTMSEARDALATAAIGPGGAAQIIGHPVRTAEGAIPSWAARHSTGRRGGSHHQPPAPVTPLPTHVPVQTQSRVTPGSHAHRSPAQPQGRVESMAEWFRVATENPRDHLVQLLAVGALVAVSFVVLVMLVVMLVS